MDELEREEMREEILEAIQVGEKALGSLRGARECLSQAGNWGIVDILGGGLITNAIKHTKIDSAREYLEQVSYDLEDFQYELEDVEEYIPEIDIDGFLTAADFFFDGFLTDIFVQTKISTAKEQVEKAIGQVTQIVYQLKSRLS